MNITAKLDRVNKITSTIMLVYQQKWPLKIKKKLNTIIQLKKYL